MKEIEILEKRIVELEKELILTKVKFTLKEKYNEKVEDIKKQFKVNLYQKIDSLFDNYKGKKKREKVSSWGSGFFGIEPTYEYKEDKNMDGDFIRELEDTLRKESISYFENWKKELNQNFIEVINENDKERKVDFDINILRKTLRRNLNDIVYFIYGFSG